MNTIIHTENAPAAIGPYSQAVQAGNLLFISGQIPVNPATGAFAGEDITTQTRQSRPRCCWQTWATSPPAMPSIPSSSPKTVPPVPALP